MGVRLEILLKERDFKRVLEAKVLERTREETGLSMSGLRRRKEEEEVKKEEGAKG